MHPFDGLAIYDPTSKLHAAGNLKLYSVRVLADLSVTFAS